MPLTKNMYNVIECYVGFVCVQGCDFWSGLEAGLLSPQDAQAGKQLLVAMVLATDMANHGADLGRLQAKLSDSAAAGGSSGTWALQPGELHQADRALALKVGARLLH